MGYAETSTEAKDELRALKNTTYAMIDQQRRHG